MVLHLVFLWFSTLGQEINTPPKEFEGLSDSARVDYVIDNFYNLYSKDFDQAKHLTEWALNISEKNLWKERQAHSALCAGVISYLSGDYEEVLPYYLESIYIFDSMNNSKGIAKVNNEMAIFYYKQNEVDQANLCLDRAEEAGRKINDLGSIGTTIHHRGTFLMRKGKYLESKPYIKEVYSIRKQLNDSIGLGYILNDLAEIAINEGDTGLSLEYTKQSTEIRTAINDKQGVAINLVNMGEIYTKLDQFGLALKHFKASLTVSTELGYADLIRYTYDQISQCHIELNQYDLAYIFREKSYQLKDSLFTMEKAKHISQLQTQYETEKKKQQIATQKLAIAEQTAINTRNIILIFGLVFCLTLFVVIAILLKNRLERKQQLTLQQKDLQYKELQLNAIIDSQEKERKRFASDLHDGFGQLISILKLNVESIDEQKDREKRHSIYEKSLSILDEMYSELRNICFNLMPQSLVKFGLEPSLMEFADKINASGKLMVEVLVFDLNDRLKDLQEISIYRIVQEWVNNVIKYSDSKKITIQLTKDRTEVTLTIEDDGMGFDLSKLSESEGNGWKNIRSRTNLIYGDVEIDTTIGKRGNLFSINIPLQQPKLIEAN